jgi:alanyl-tRNA synthetase
LGVIRKRFEEFSFPFESRPNILSTDESTLFICSGMQPIKSRFYNSDFKRDGSIQSCVRTNDLELVGDGSHLTYFQMVGNFSFGGNDFETSVELWHSIVRDLQIPVSEVSVHPSQTGHKSMWIRRGYNVVNDWKNTWSDGDIEGYCCELFCGNLEIGNLVNPLGHSTDVGFGLERLHQVVERKNRTDETSLFEQQYHPVVRDHIRTLKSLKQHDIQPSNKKHGYVCRRLLRRILNLVDFVPGLEDWMLSERDLRNNQIEIARRKWQKFQDKDEQFWWETFGILPEELSEIKIKNS